MMADAQDVAIELGGSGVSPGLRGRVNALRITARHTFLIRAAVDAAVATPWTEAKAPEPSLIPHQVKAAPVSDPQHRQHVPGIARTF